MTYDLEMRVRRLELKVAELERLLETLQRREREANQRLVTTRAANSGSD